MILRRKNGEKLHPEYRALSLKNITTKMEQDKQFLIDTANMKMPFGKYKGVYLIDIPEFYMVWYKNKGFPAGKLGRMMALVYELKLNGLEDILRKIRS